VLEFPALVFVIFLVFAAISGLVIGAGLAVVMHNRELDTLRYELHQARAGQVLEVVIQRDGHGLQLQRLTSVPRDVAHSALWAAAQGREFTVRGMGDAGLSRGQFEALRDDLLRAGLLDWVNDSAHQLGVSWTATGEALLSQVRAHV